MARVHTHYDNLKVARDAPPEVIRAAYKILSQKHHPDRNNNSKEAIRIIQLINTAYDVLSDPTRRREHDEWIARAERGNQSEGMFGHHREQSHPRPTSHTSTKHESRRSRRHAGFLSRLVHQGNQIWDRLCRRVARKVFR